MRVKNMESERSGRAVANQFVVEFKDMKIFQSYDTPICAIMKDKNKIWLNRDYWDYSRTTAKYLAQFMRENTAEDWFVMKKELKKYGVAVGRNGVVMALADDESFKGGGKHEGEDYKCCALPDGMGKVQDNKIDI